MNIIKYALYVFLAMQVISHAMDNFEMSPIPEEGTIREAEAEQKIISEKLEALQETQDIQETILRLIYQYRYQQLSYVVSLLTHTYLLQLKKAVDYSNFEKEWSIASTAMKKSMQEMKKIKNEIVYIEATNKNRFQNEEEKSLRTRIKSTKQKHNLSQ